jgi:thiol-disulfide isomerase/thioredoxin
LRLIVLLLIGLAGAACDRQKPTGEQAAAGPGALVKGIDRSHRGEAAPSVGFRDPDGGDVDLASFRGKPLLVNLWASWCAPCVKELPTLDRLAVARDGELSVIAVSQDMASQTSVKAFLETHGIASLGAIHDPEMGLTSALGVQVMPTTVLYDPAGKEVWRFTGDLDWTGAEASKLLAETSPATAH